MQAYLSHIRLTLLVSWIVVLGLLAAYPRFQPMSALPGEYSSFQIEVRKNRAEYDSIIAKGKINLMVRQMNGAAKPGDLTAADRVLEDRALLALQMLRAQSRAGVSFKTADPLASRSALMAMDAVSGVIRLTGTPADAGWRRQGIDQALKLGQAEVRRLTKAGRVNPEAAAQWLWLAGRASTSGREWELLALVKALQDPAVPKNIALERLRSRAIVIIESRAGGQVAGYIVDPKGSVVVPFRLSASALPATVSAELRRWTVGLSLWLRVICVMAAVLAATLIPLERHLSNREPRYTSDSQADVKADYVKALRLRREMARVRKGLDTARGSSRLADADSPASRIGLRELLLSQEAIWTLAVSTAVVFVLCLFVAANPQVPARDKELQALITHQVNMEEFTVVRYW